jgi:tryptophan-rich sensory protein
MRSVITLFVFVALVALAASFGALFPPGEWYESLRKPPLNPPNWVFGPVWTLLYLGIAAAAWRVWRAQPGFSAALGLWIGQLLLNALWSLLFFGLQRPALALVDIVLLLVLVVATTVFFFVIDAIAGALFVPYLAWVAFATYLNAALWYLNR